MKPVVETGSLFDKSKDKKWISMMYWKCSEAAALWEGRYNSKNRTKSYLMEK